jgi:hypothetical protein
VPAPALTRAVAAEDLADLVAHLPADVAADVAPRHGGDQHAHEQERSDVLDRRLSALATHGRRKVWRGARQHMGPRAPLGPGTGPYFFARAVQVRYVRVSRSVFPRVVRATTRTFTVVLRLPCSQFNRASAAVIRSCSECARQTVTLFIRNAKATRRPPAVSQ